MMLYPQMHLCHACRLASYYFYQDCLKIVNLYDSFSWAWTAALSYCSVDLSPEGQEVGART